MGVAIKGMFGLSGFLPLLVMSLLVIILVYDIHHKIIPDGIVYVFISLAFVQMFIGPGPIFVVPGIWDLLAGPLLFLPFFALWYFSKGLWMGLGDGKLALGMGWFLGLEGGVTTVLLAFWIGAIVSLVVLFYVAIKHKSFLGFRKKMKLEIPFAPFLILGFLIVFYFEFNLGAFIL